MREKGFNPGKREEINRSVETFQKDDPFVLNKEMYRLPGDPELSFKDLERYWESNKKINERLVKKLEKIFNKGDISECEKVVDFLEEVSAGEKKRLQKLLESLIDQKLTSDWRDWRDWRDRKHAVSLVSKISLEERAKFLERGLDDTEDIVVITAAKLIDQVPENEQFRLREKVASIIERKIESEDFSDRLYACELLNFISTDDRSRFISKMLDDTEPWISLKAVIFLSQVDRAKRGDLHEKAVDVVRKSFESQEARIRERAIDYLDFIPIDERATYIERLLEDEKDGLRLQAVKAIDFAPKNEQPKLRKEAVKIIENGLKSSDLFLCQIALSLIFEAPLEERKRLIEVAFQSHFFDLIRTATKLIDMMPENEQTGLRDSLVSYIERSNSNSVRKVRLIVDLIAFTPQSEQERLYTALIQVVEQWFNDGSEFSTQSAVSVISRLPFEKIKYLLEKHSAIFDKLSKFAVQTQLYSKKEEKRFFHRKFEKTGSGTTLLDLVPGKAADTLKERLIVRHISLVAYMTWKKAYDSSETWKAEGFDYVPIEPIVKVVSVDNERVDVFTKVLRGPSVLTWRVAGGIYIDHIDVQIGKITKVLSDLGISHGHPHNGNFIVYFDRDEQGKADLTKPPRVYMIDFDASVSFVK